MSLKEFFKILKDNKVKYLDEQGEALNHWTIDKSKEYKKRQIVMDLFTALNDERGKMADFIVVNKCKNPLCVNPDCYTFKFRTSDIADSILDIADEIDLESYNQYGEEAYLKMFNDSVPSILRITRKQLKTAIVYLRKMKGK